MAAERPASFEIGRQVHGDEGELEAAGEEAEHEQHIGAVLERLGQGLADRLVRNGRGAPLSVIPGRPRREGESERHDEQHARGEDE